MVLTNNSNIPRTAETTITTRTTEIGQQQQLGSGIPQQQILQKNPIITNIHEKPVLENVIEKKNVEVHHKNVVQEIHEQKIIEIEKQPMIQQVNQGTVVQQQRAETRYEEIGTGAFNEQDRLRMQNLNAVVQPTITHQQGAVRQVAEGEVVAQVVRQEFVERHVQPVITEIREQNVIQTVEQPIVRKIHEAPIIREVSSSSAQYTQLSDVEFRERYHRGFPFQLASNWQRPSHMNENEWTQWRTSSQQAGMFARPQTGFTDEQWRQWHDHNTRSQFGGFQQGLTQQSGLIGQQQGLNQQKPGLMQNIEEHLHMGGHQQQGLGQQGLTQQPLLNSGLQQQGLTQQPLLNSGLQQSGLIGQQQGLTQQPLLNSGLQQSGLLNQQSGLQQQGLIQGVKQELGLGQHPSVLPQQGIQQPLQQQGLGQNFRQL